MSETKPPAASAASDKLKLLGASNALAATYVTESSNQSRLIHRSMLVAHGGGLTALVLVTAFAGVPVSTVVKLVVVVLFGGGMLLAGATSYFSYLNLERFANQMRDDFYRELDRIDRAPDAPLPPAPPREVAYTGFTPSKMFGWLSVVIFFVGALFFAVAVLP